MLSKVYFIGVGKDETAEEISKKAAKVFSVLDFKEKIEKDSFVACKIHFGEKGNKGFINPRWLEGIINLIREKTSRAFFVDTNTLYVGRRTNSIDHLNLAHEHGFSIEALGIPILIADGIVGRDDYEIEINCSRIKRAKIASAFFHTDFLLCLSHFTGHMITGFGAAIKNLGMGCASRAGKLEQHAEVHPWVNPKLCNNCGICIDYCPSQAIQQREGKASIIDEKCLGCGECLVVCPAQAVKFRWDSDFSRVQEKMAEYAFSVSKLFKERMGFINFLMKITRDCDCLAKEQKSLIEDIGILGSSDPVAVDKASVDLVNRNRKDDFVKGFHNIDWSVQIRHAQEIGLGRMDYELVTLQ